VKKLMTTGSTIAVTLGIGAALGVGLDRTLFAQAPGITRTVLQRVDAPSAKNYELVMATAVVAPGGSAGRHIHHGVEIGYVLEGSVVFDHQGRPAVTKKAGEYFENDVEAIHDAKNTGTTPAKLLAVYLVEKGKPLADPAK